MNLETITLTDGQLKSLAINSNIKPNLLCLLPEFDESESVSPPPLDAAQQEVLKAALQPLNTTDMAVLLGNDGLMRLQFSLRGEAGVLIGEADQSNQLLPTSEGDVATMVMAYLAQGGEPLKRAVALNLSQQAFLLLMAAADAYKMSYLEDLLKHTVSAANLTVKSLTQAVEQAYENPDLRWLLPFVLFRSEEFPTLDITAALAELAEVGLIETEGVVLTEEGSLFIDDLMYRKVIADITSFYVQDAALARSQVMFIRTEQTLWAVQFGDRDAALRSLTIDEACELMVSLLSQKDEPASRSAQKAGQQEGTDQAETKALTCSQCGHQLSSGMKFCVKCGTPVPLSDPPKAPSFCKHCGTKLKPGDHFCVKCGKLSD
jgi:DNA-directed RNA polymerase subunit RPC12/RpoP